MARPPIIDLLQLVATDVEVFELRALNGRELQELVVGNVKPLELQEAIILSENGHVLDPIIRKVKLNKPAEFPHWTNFRKSIVREINFLDIPDLVHGLL